jgi:hypothetical protein
VGVGETSLQASGRNLAVPFVPALNAWRQHPVAQKRQIENAAPSRLRRRASLTLPA